MKISKLRIKFLTALALMSFTFAGCESTDSGGHVSGSVYYGVGFYDPWYYGGYYDDPDYVVTPPDRPNNPDRPHVEHHARPTPTPASRPTPSIPSMPRMGGGGRRR
jgi:hypothetical protein